MDDIPVESLSPEQLRAELILIRKREQAGALKLKQAEQKVAELSVRLHEAEEDKGALRAEVAKGRNENQRVREDVLDFAKTAAELTAGMQQHAIILDELQAMSLSDMLKILGENLVFWIDKCKSLYRETPMGGTGPDLKPTGPGPAGPLPGGDDDEDEEKAGNNGANPESTDGSAEGSANPTELLNKVVGHLRQASASTVLGRKRLCQAINELKKINPELAAAVKELPPELIELLAQTPPVPDKKPLRGRQAKRRPPDVKRHSKDGNGGGCRKCGAPLELLESESGISTMQGSIIAGMSDSRCLVKVMENIYSFYRCSDPNCGHIHFFPNPHMDLPVVPNREIGIDLVIEVCSALHQGMPVERTCAVIKQRYELGNSTIPNSVHDFLHFYVKPIYGMIKAVARQAEVLCLDETPFDCQEAQGQRVCRTDKAANAAAEKARDDKLSEGGSEAEAAAAAKEAHDEILAHSSSSYVLAMRSTPMAKQQFVCYEYMGARTRESLRKIIDKEFKFKVIVTDGWPGYGWLIRECFPEVKHQCCNMHMRRKVIPAGNLDQLVGSVGAMEEGEAIDYLKQQLIADTFPVEMLIVFYEISALYVQEQSIDYLNPGWEKRIIEVRKNQKIIYDDIDARIKRLAKGTAIQVGSKWRNAKASNPVGKVCAYYLNRADELKAFLDSTDVPMDSSAVEQSIRPLVLLRGAANFMGGVHGMEDLCMIYSVWETAELMGFDKFEQWLRAYSRTLHVHVVEKMLTELTNKEECDWEMGKKILKWDMEHLTKGFDFSAWNMMTPEGRGRRDQTAIIPPVTRKLIT